MNKYFETNDRFNSNKRIFDAYYEEAERSVGGIRGALDSVLYLLSVILSAVLCERVRRIARALAICICFVGFVGVIGAIDHGSISLGTGLLIALALLAIELLCFKKSARR